VLEPPAAPTWTTVRLHDLRERTSELSDIGPRCVNHFVTCGDPTFAQVSLGVPR